MKPMHESVQIPATLAEYHALCAARAALRAARPSPDTIADIRSETRFFEPIQNADPVASVRRFSMDATPGRPDITVFQPRDTSSLAAGCVLFIHGGGWVTGSVNQYGTLIARLAQRGLTIAAVHYRLAPEHPFPAALEDCLAAAAALHERFGTLTICGDSAGANLGAAVAAEMPSAFGRAAWLYGVFDLARLPPDPVLSLMADSYAGPADRAHPRLSPLQSADRQPTTLLVAPSEDPLRPQSTRMAAALVAAGVGVVLDVVPDVSHGFLQCELFEASIPAIDRIAAWLRP